MSQKIKIDEEIKEYHRKRCYELSVKSLGVIPILDEPTWEQKQWVIFRLNHPETWPNVRENKIGDCKNWR